MFYYVIIPDVLAYPTEIDLPTGESEMNTTEFRYPKHFSQRRLNELIASKMPLAAYDDLPTAVKAIDKLTKERVPVPTHVSGILCFPKDKLGVSYVMSSAGASGEKTVTWVLESSPVINTVCFWSVLPITAPHLWVEKPPEKIREKAFDLLFFDDYANALSTCYRVAEPASTYTSEKELISACEALNIAKITEIITSILTGKFSISAVPLVFLLAKVVTTELACALKVAITLLIIQGEHECLYKDEVYDNLFTRIGKFNQTWLPDFLKALVEALRMGCFKSCDYDDFLKNAQANKVAECYAFIEKGLAACHAHKKAMRRLSFLKPHGGASPGSVSTESVEEAIALSGSGGVGGAM